jgi:hypothetical protein
VKIYRSAAVGKSVANKGVEFVEKLRVCFEREHLRRTGIITVLVGTWLTLFNHAGLLLAGSIDLELLVKVILNYATPFIVSNAGLLSRQDERDC